MDTIAAIREMVKDSGLTQSEVSRRMVRSSRYIGVIISANKDVRIATLCEIAHTCGFKVVVMGKSGKTIELGNAQQNRR